jgi:hypothetical protein
MNRNTIVKRSVLPLRIGLASFVVAVGIVVLLEAQRPKLPVCLNHLDVEKFDVTVVQTESPESESISYETVIGIAKPTLLKAVETTSFRIEFSEVKNVLPKWSCYENTLGESVTIIEGDRLGEPTTHQQTKTSILYERRLTLWEKCLRRFGLIKVVHVNI